MTKGPWTLPAAALLMLAAPVVSAQSPASPAGAPAQGQIIQQIIVKVNGDIFTKTDLEGRQIQALRDKNLIVDPAKGVNDAALRGALLEVTPDILVAAVDELLQVQRAH